MSPCSPARLNEASRDAHASARSGPFSARVAALDAIAFGLPVIGAVDPDTFAATRRGQATLTPSAGPRTRQAMTVHELLHGLVTLLSICDGHLATRRVVVRLGPVSCRLTRGSIGSLPSIGLVDDAHRTRPVPRPADLIRSLTVSASRLRGRVPSQICRGPEIDRTRNATRSRRAAL